MDAVSRTTEGVALSSNPTTSVDRTTDLADQDVFLQLLVAQLSNQDPLDPRDGTEFVSQLAEFSSLEQLTQIREAVEALRTPTSDEGQPPSE